MSQGSELKIRLLNNAVDFLMVRLNFIYIFRVIWFAVRRETRGFSSDSLTAIVLMMSGDTAVHADRFCCVVHVVVAWTLLLLGLLSLRLLVLALIVLRLGRSSVPVAGVAVVGVGALSRVVEPIRTEVGLNRIHFFFVVLNCKDWLLFVLSGLLLAGDVDGFVERGRFLSLEHFPCFFRQANLEQLEREEFEDFGVGLGCVCQKLGLSVSGRVCRCWRCRHLRVCALHYLLDSVNATSVVADSFIGPLLDVAELIQKG